MFDQNRGSAKWKASVLLTGITFIWLVQVREVETGSSRWSRGLKRASASAGLLGLRVRIPCRGHGYLSLVNVMCGAGRGLCDWPILHPGEPYRV